MIDWAAGMNPSIRGRGSSANGAMPAKAATIATDSTPAALRCADVGRIVANEVFESSD
jgi:hypothetical protein